MIVWLVFIISTIAAFVAFPWLLPAVLFWIVFMDGWRWFADVFEDWREARAERKRLGDLARYL